ncbi:MAG: hypothetical protein IKK04_09015 [Bacteroidales bacterium]|nr:hypothetical protein [Bacteroidales bacterium]
MQFVKSKYFFNSGEGENETFKDFTECLPTLSGTPHPNGKKHLTSAP